MDQITRIASDLNDKTDNVYQLVYEIAELAKKLVDEATTRRHPDEFGYDTSYEMFFTSKKII